MTKLLNHSEAIVRGAAPPPIARLVGFDLVSVKPGEAVIDDHRHRCHLADTRNSKIGFSILMNA